VSVSERRAKTRRRTFDTLAALNVVALLVNELSAFPSGGTGFKFFTFALLGLFLVAWIALRRYEYPLWALLALELALLGHIAGRLLIVGDINLYRATLLGMPGDKIVHAFNSAAGAVFVTVLLDRIGIRVHGWGAFVVVMVVSGLGAGIEIIEYIGTLVLPHTNVGGYANNMQDLIANLAGAIMGWAIGVWLLAGEARPSDA